MAAPASSKASQSVWDRPSAYEQWIATQGIPLHRGYFVDDLRTVEVGWWEQRGCNAAFLVLAGQEGVSEVRVSEIPPGASTSPARLGVDEIVYVVDGRGMATVSGDGQRAKTFEWQKHSLFLIPRHAQHQLSNARGDQPARLLHYNALPLAMMVIPDPDFLINGPYIRAPIADDEGADLYSEAKLVHENYAGASGTYGRGTYWRGNFFPDMRAWDQLLFHEHRGAGGSVVWINYPQAPLWDHMSVFSDRLYKKGHRHGPGTLIVIVEGEGYSYLWEEGKEKILVPWHEGSVTVPPDSWYHQHFNVGRIPARYLAFHSPRANNDYQRRVAQGNSQIEYADEDPLIRQTFEAELAKRGLTSLMPPLVYTDRNFEWEEPKDGA